MSPIWANERILGSLTKSKMGQGEMERGDEKIETHIEMEYYSKYDFRVPSEISRFCDYL